MSRAAWIEEGARVAILSGREERVTGAVIERVLKRDVVLNNGDRFSLAYANGECIRRRRGGAWDPDDLLYPASSPRVRQARAAERRRRLIGAARAASDAIDKALRAGDLATAEAEYDRLGSHLSALAEVAAP